MGRLQLLINHISPDADDQDTQFLLSLLSQAKIQVVLTQCASHSNGF